MHIFIEISTLFTPYFFQLLLSCPDWFSDLRSLFSYASISLGKKEKPRPHNGPIATWFEIHYLANNIRVFYPLGGAI